jgi:hypothetical protein
MATMKHAMRPGALLVMAACSNHPVCLDICPDPTVAQVFVNARTGNGLPVSDPSGDTPDLGRIDGNDLTYGLHDDVGACAVDGSCPAGLACSADRICVDADGRQPGVRDAIAAPSADGAVPLIQIVFHALLDGATVERFACACARVVHVANDGTASVTPGNCGGHDVTSDGGGCRDCPDDPDTPGNEAGQCFDVDGDGVPDLESLVPGIVTVTCDGGFSWQNGAGDGLYDPAGNRIVPIDVGFEGIGPRLYLHPPIAFPYDADCRLTLSPDLMDKHGRAVEDPGTIAWHTEPAP